VEFIRLRDETTLLTEYRANYRTLSEDLNARQRTNLRASR